MANYWDGTPGGKHDSDGEFNGRAEKSFRVIGSHPQTRNFFDIEVKAKDSLGAFGAAALVLKEAGNDDETEFYVAIECGQKYELPGESVVSMGTVLDPEQAEVFGLTD